MLRNEGIFDEKRGFFNEKRGFSTEIGRPDQVQQVEQIPKRQA